MVVYRWHPVTHDMGLIQAPVEQVVAGLLDGPVASCSELGGCSE